jgi:hypothetical protein
MSATTKSIIMLSLMLSAVVYASAYSQYRLIKQEVINNQTVCTYENVRGDIITRTHKPKKQCAKYINTDRD